MGSSLNRWQLLHIAGQFESPAAIIGDFLNALGPTKVPYFKDIGPRESTHKASDIVSLRLDRCLGRGQALSIESKVLSRGPSDHHPILLDLVTIPGDA